MKEKESITTQNSRDIEAAPEVLYHAFTNPEALENWMAPGEMTGKIYRFDLKIGGGYQMSLFYPPSEKGSPGITSEKEDRFTAKFIELMPFKKIVEAITFDSTDPSFSGEMIMDISFRPIKNKTRVTIIFKNISPGIRVGDNEAGTALTLEKLGRLVSAGQFLI